MHDEIDMLHIEVWLDNGDILCVRWTPDRKSYALALVTVERWHADALLTREQYRQTKQAVKNMQFMFLYS